MCPLSSPTSPERAALYVRVSTADQTCALQLRELQQYVQHRGWNLAGIYEDTLSGAKASRPGLDRLLADARRRRFDIVAVWKLDRFGRSLLDCLAGIQELSSVGIRFLAITQSIDTDQSNPTAKLLLQLLAAVSEFERELIRERVSAGLKAAKARGQTLGRPRKIFDRAEVVRLRRERLSITKIAQELHLGVGTVFRVLETSAKAGRAAALPQ